jgi:nicotinamidase-related amidase
VPRPSLNLEPAHTALVISECQNNVVGPDSMLPALAAAAAPVLPVIARLAGAARKAGVPVVHLTFSPVLGNRSSNVHTPLLATANRQEFGGDGAAESRAGQVVEEIGTEPGDLVLRRHTGVSPTHNTELFALLRNIGVRSVLLAGVSLNVAIPVATTELADEGFRVAIARESVAGTPAEHAESMLRHTLRHLAVITTVDEVVAAWS